ncbi:MAG: NAD(P)H-hydrate dehydratase [Candidatus Woesearchaeota archaeon]|nr:NAD(P)H-hydrate dehydratase [Candidatus Woesearchaeota archaeon]
MKYLTKSILKIEKRKPTAHKGDYGRVLVVAGSQDYVGAAALACMAAEAVLRSGADVVTIAAPEKTAWAVNCMLPDIITKKFRGRYFSKKHAADIIKLSENYDVILIGPGIGSRKETLAFAKEICKKIKKLKVIDADALKAIKLQDVSNAILTPHIKEFEILSKNSGLLKENLRDFRKLINNNVILLKGPIDKIISKNKIAFNKTGNPVMAKAGTGDVLAGICAGFLAQTKDLFRSACMAAYLNGAVGDYLLKEKGRTFIASDIIKNIHKVFR